MHVLLLQAMMDKEAQLGRALEHARVAEEQRGKHAEDAKRLSTQLAELEAAKVHIVIPFQRVS